MGRKKRCAYMREGGRARRWLRRAGKYAIAAVPEDSGDGGDAEKFDGGIEEREGEDGVLVGQHVVAIALRRIRRAALRSRLKSCTTLMPEMCSCRNALMRAMAVRMRRLASRTKLRKNQVTTKISGNTAKVASASVANS